MIALLYCDKEQKPQGRKIHFSLYKLCQIMQKALSKRESDRQRVFTTMRQAHSHSFEILTKRVERLVTLSPTLLWRPHYLDGGERRVRALCVAHRRAAPWNPCWDRYRTSTGGASTG